MFYLIDSHCHLHDPEFFTPEQAEEALKNAHANNIQKIICIGTNHADSLRARDFAQNHENVYWTYGIHPESASENTHPDLGDNTPIAIGEVGLDYHYGRENRTAQIQLLNELLELATQKNLPVSFHVREAFDDWFGIINNFPELRAVVHCFTDSKKTLRRILSETNFYIGVDGIATYSTLPTPPLSRVLLETDAPFLAPVPHRGEPNQPAYIKNIAEWLAIKLDVTPEVVAVQTTENCQKLFNF